MSEGLILLSLQDLITENIIRSGTIIIRLSSHCQLAYFAPAMKVSHQIACLKDVSILCNLVGKSGDSDIRPDRLCLTRCQNPGGSEALKQP